MSSMTESVARLSRRQIAWRAAQDIENGWYVNLGIGLPTLAASYVPDGREIVFHSENGLLGVGGYPKPGEEDADLINATKEYVTLAKGASVFKHSDSFTMIRGGHLDLALLGAFEVSVKGDLANWTTEDPNFPPGVGGAMDLAVGAKRIRVLMEHTTRKGEPKIRTACQYPLTASAVVKRLYTDLAVIDVTEAGLLVVEMAEGLTREALQAVTEAPLAYAATLGVLKAPAVQ